ncbi:MAG: hemerythrin domain-containing protein [Bacteroidetes bacterium]|nr:hemerythrin domain-containing protein [Bacteroidota bacterium]
MLRFNIFNMIHKALRGMLYNTAQSIQQTWFGDKADAELVFEKIHEVVAAFENHGHHEDHILMPYVEKYDPVRIASFESEHVEDLYMGNHLKHLINIYRDAATDQERMIAGSAITRAFQDYMIFNLKHMQREEIELNELLWEVYTDEQLLDINAGIIASIPADEMAQTAGKMMMSINKNEALNWLSSVKKTAPAFVYNPLLELTETHLPEHYREEIRAALLEEENLSPVF